MTGVADLPRWAWVAAGLLVGLTHGWVREWSTVTDPLDAYAVILTDQRQFEHALGAESHGQRHFKDITVYPHWPRGGLGGVSKVHLVTGLYWDGRADVKDGQVVATWEPACYVAPVPYNRASGQGQDARGESVVDYLATLRETRGVESRYAWWWWARRPLCTSSLAGAPVIGGMLPSVLTLLAYGTLLRPPREKRASLWKVRIPRRRPVPPPAVAAGVPVGGAESAQSSATAPAEAVTPPAPMQPLPPSANNPVEAPHAEETHYGARREDFYPTELHFDAKPR